MPNLKTHLGTSAAFSVGVELVTQIGQGDLDIGKLLIAALGGAVGGAAPDILEPAYHPNHRQAFHSVGTLAVVGAGTATALRRLDNSPQNVFFRSFGLGYASHLVLDATTPKGLPLLGKV